MTLYGKPWPPKFTEFKNVFGGERLLLNSAHVISLRPGGSAPVSNANDTTFNVVFDTDTTMIQVVTNLEYRVYGSLDQVAQALDPFSQPKPSTPKQAQ